MARSGTTGRAPALSRLLAAAVRIFYADGIRSVPVDRIIDEAKVTRATFYRYFSSKEDLVLAYVKERDQRIRDAAQAAAERSADPGDLLRALVDGVAAEVCGPGFRGCPFINAAAEYPDPTHPVHQAVTEHRAWFRETLISLFAALGHADPARSADLTAMLRDGAMVGGYLDGPEGVGEQLADAVRILVDRG